MKISICLFFIAPPRVVRALPKKLMFVRSQVRIGKKLTKFQEAHFPAAPADTASRNHTTTPPRHHATTPPRHHATTPPRRHTTTPPRRHADTPTRRHAKAERKRNTKTKQANCSYDQPPCEAPTTASRPSPYTQPRVVERPTVFLSVANRVVEGPVRRRPRSKQEKTYCETERTRREASRVRECVRVSE